MDPANLIKAPVARQRPPLTRGLRRRASRQLVISNGSIASRKMFAREIGCPNSNRGLRAVLFSDYWFCTFLRLLCRDPTRDKDGHAVSTPTGRNQVRSTIPSSFVFAFERCVSDSPHVAVFSAKAISRYVLCRLNLQHQKTWSGNCF